MARDPASIRDAASDAILRAGLPPDRLDDALSHIVPAHERMQAALPVSAVDRWLEPGRRETVGPLELEVRHTPGHDTTHVSYVLEVEGERALVAGDMAIRPFRAYIVRTGWAPGLERDVDAFHAGLDRLASLGVDRVYPGHGPAHAALGPTLERDRASLERRVDACADAVADAGSTPYDVATALAGDGAGPGRLLPEAAAALCYLERDGRLDAWTDDGLRYYAPA